MANFETILLTVTACLLTVVGMRQLLILLFSRKFQWKVFLSGIGGAGIVISQTVVQGDMALILIAISSIITFFNIPMQSIHGAHHG